jgi:hypothetical protein
MTADPIDLIPVRQSPLSVPAVLAGLVLLLAPGFVVAEGNTSSLCRQSFRTDTAKTVTWSELAGTKATVVVFLSFDCPMSNSYARLLSDMVKAYAGKGVAFVGFCPCDEEAAQVAKHAKEYQIGFPIFKDESLSAANALHVKVVPQVFVLDSKNEITYSGLIDDGYIKRLVPNKTVSQHYLKNALDETLSGKSVSVKRTEPIGCSIARETRKGTGSETTYYKDVLPIVQNRCQGCHRPGEVGPFSLMTYKQAVNWAEDLKEYTQNHKMPPWKPGGGKEFRDERRLTDKEIRTISQWVDAGCAEGDARDARPPVKFVAGWSLGKPDLILSVPDDFVLGPTGKDLFRVFVIPTGLTEDKHVVALEVRPGNRRIVHHALNFFDTTGSARNLQDEKQAQERKRRKPDDVDVGPGFSSAMGIGFRPRPTSFLGGKQPFGALSGWAPGIVPKELPAGTGFSLPKGSDFVMQVHYHRDGRTERDRTQVGLYFAKKPVERSMLGLVVPGRFKTDAKPGPERGAAGRFGRLGYIPAGDSHFIARGSWLALEDCTLYSVMPHMHLLGKSVKITMTPPEGGTETLIDVPEWDYNWQENYFLKTPIKVKSGTRFEIEAVYDNSESNPSNPNNPPVDVRFGEQTTNEMLFGFLGATKDKPGTGLPYFIMQGPFRMNR